MAFKIPRLEITSPFNVLLTALISDSAVDVVVCQVRGILAKWVLLDLQMLLGLNMLMTLRSVIFHCSPTPEMPAPESRICREDLAWTVIIRLSLVMRRFIRGFFVGVEYFVIFRLSCASSVTSMLGMGREDEDVDSEVSTVGGGESELSESDSDKEE